MKFYYDLHIHSCLSPCGDEDMTPNNIVNMSIIKELDVIAITDHNSIKNCRAAINAAKGTKLLVLAGMEIQTLEDVHLIVLFPDIDYAEKFDDAISEYRFNFPHKAEKFGDQMILDEKDQLIGYEKYTLMLSMGISIDKAIDMAIKYNGIAFPAHINRPSNSVIANLGFIPENWPIGAVEIFRQKENRSLVEEYSKKYKIVSNSDAHYLKDISEAENFMNLKLLSAEEVIKYLSK